MKKFSVASLIIISLISNSYAGGPTPSGSPKTERVNYKIETKTEDEFNKIIPLDEQYVMINTDGTVHEAAWSSLNQAITSMVVNDPPISYFVHQNNQDATIITEKPFHKNTDTSYGLAIRAFFNIRDYETEEWDSEGIHHDAIDTHYIVPLSSTVIKPEYYSKNKEVFSDMPTATSSKDPQARLDAYAVKACDEVRAHRAKQRDVLKIFKTNDGFHPARKIIKGVSEQIAKECGKEAEWCGKDYPAQMVYYNNPIMFYDLRNQPANSKINVLYYAGDGTTEIYKDSVFNKDNWVATYTGGGHMNDIDDVMGVMSIPMSAIEKVRQLGQTRFIYRMKNARDWRCPADFIAVERSWLDFAVVFEIVGKPAS